MLSQTLVKYCRDLLQVDNIPDFCPNGLQVEGTPDVQRLVTGVSASYALIEAAIETGADALLVHHGYFWKGEEAVLTGIKQRRLKALLKHNINLLVYHLPLDVHADYGNNVQLAKRCDWHIERSVALDGIADLLWLGRTRSPIGATDFAKELGQQVQREPLHIPGQTDNIERIAWCTGAAQRYVEQAAEYDIDAYITGEVSEHTVHVARETGLHFFAAGHHATERYGIQALGEHLATQFNLQHQFIDIDNPV